MTKLLIAILLIGCGIYFFKDKSDVAHAVQLQAQVDEAKSQLDKAQAELAKEKHSTETLSAQLVQKQTALDTAQNQVATLSRVVAAYSGRSSGAVAGTYSGAPVAPAAPVATPAPTPSTPFVSPLDAGGSHVTGGVLGRKK
jgi:hypothetical protein